MKYLLVKAWLGFGDRLQGLKMCVKYAQEHNRAILVDWSDSIFSHIKKMKCPDCLTPLIISDGETRFPRNHSTVKKIEERKKEEVVSQPDGTNLGQTCRPC